MDKVISRRHVLARRKFRYRAHKINMIGIGFGLGLSVTTSRLGATKINWNSELIDVDHKLVELKLFLGTHALAVGLSTFTRLQPRI